jgi:molybdate transport system regulatory protein
MAVKVSQTEQKRGHVGRKMAGAPQIRAQSRSVKASQSKKGAKKATNQDFPDATKLTHFSARPRLRVLVGHTIALGPGKAELLERLQASGSITKAAQEMKMSYMRAWTLIRTMNRSFNKPVVVSNHGGASGGGAQLTATGRAVLALYREMETECLRAINPLQKRLEKHL